MSTQAPQGGFSIATGLQWVEGGEDPRGSYHARDSIVIERLQHELGRTIEPEPWKHAALTMLKEFVLAKDTRSDARNQRVWEWLHTLPAKPDTAWVKIPREGYHRHMGGFDLYVGAGTERGWPLTIYYRGHGLRYGTHETPESVHRRVPTGAVLDDLMARVQAMVTPHFCELVGVPVPDDARPMEGIPR